MTIYYKLVIISQRKVIITTNSNSLMQRQCLKDVYKRWFYEWTSFPKVGTTLIHTVLCGPNWTILVPSTSCCTFCRQFCLITNDCCLHIFTSNCSTYILYMVWWMRIEKLIRCDEGQIFLAWKIVYYYHYQRKSF